jgi:hypothetical protein
MDPNQRTVDYDEFLAWLREQESLAGRSEAEWSAAFPKCEQAIYRNGMWYAFHEAGAALERFSKEA